MHVRVLGTLELATDDAIIPIRRGRPRRLFLALFVRAGEPVSIDTLVEDLWSVDTPQNANNALQILVSYLRKVFAVDEGGSHIDTVDGGYRLRLDPGRVDAAIFEGAVRRLDSVAAPAERLVVSDGAIALWRGQPLAEATYDSFAQGEIRRLNELRLVALEARMDALLDLGRHREATTELQRIVADHPLHERFHAQLMVALYRSGRQADALRFYDSARATLVEELGLDPGPELQRLARDVLDQAPSLDVAPVGEQGSFASPRPATADDAVPSAIGRLPEPAAPLIGRDADRDRLVELLGTNSLVTLTGPGGAGKTRLALAAVERLATAGANVWWADLGGAATEEDVLTTIAGAVGASTQPDDTGEGIATHLSGRGGTLVLDTCEHVVASVRRLVGMLRRDAGSLVVLATSRQPLRAGGELAWPVSPLALPPTRESPLSEIAASSAVQLFVERAVHARPDFELTPATAPSVAQAVLLLDGLPLAIELAAAHVATVSPSKLVDLLKDRLRVLVDDRRDGRQHTLRATIDWSYDHLTEDEARLFERLAVFTGSFSVDGAARVASDPSQDGFELIVGLARQSLIAPAGNDRFRLLDTLRAYAHERLHARSDDEIRHLRNQHAAWYAEFALDADRSIRGPDAGWWLGELRAELPNLRAALEHSFDGGDALVGARLAAALSWFWSIDGLVGEAARWLAVAGPVAPEASELAADVLAGMALHAASLGDLNESAASAAAAAEIYSLHNADAPLARTLVFLGIAQWGLGDLDVAATTQDRAVGIYRRLRDHWGHGLALVVRARTAADQGDDGTVVRLLDSALPITRRAGDAHVVGLCLEQRARVALRLGDDVLAQQLALEAVETSERVGYAEGIAAARFALGHAVAARDLDEAERNYAAGLRIAIEIDLPGAVAEGLESLAAVAAVQGEVGDAARLLAAADATRDRAELPRLRTQQLTVAHALAAERRLDESARRAARTAGRLLDVTRLVEELTASHEGSSKGV